jgi:hypothetical protein
MKPKYLIPIGYVRVVVGYYGKAGEDTTGAGRLREMKNLHKPHQ